MKIPFGLKIVSAEITGGKMIVTFKLKWWYAIYTAIVSCFSARWYAEHDIEIEEKKKE